MSWKPVYSQALAVFMMICLALTAYISQQAAETEKKIVTSVKMAIGITQSGDVNNPRYDKAKKELLANAREGIDINTHYRKITPMVADELAKWGDWKNAVWIWESVIESRPYVVAIMTNVARGYAQIGNNEKALEYLVRAEKLQPKATSVRSLKVVLYSRTGKEPEAFALAKQYLQDGTFDYDLASAAWVLAMRKSDFDTAIKALELRNAAFPTSRADGYLKLAQIYTNHQKDDAKALASYKSALEFTADQSRAELRKQIPPAYLARL
jgi:O-antigen ligase